MTNTKPETATRRIYISPDESIVVDVAHVSAARMTSCFSRVVISLTCGAELRVDIPPVGEYWMIAKAELEKITAMMRGGE